MHVHELHHLDQRSTKVSDPEQAQSCASSSCSNARWSKQQSVESIVGLTLALPTSYIRIHKQCMNYEALPAVAGLLQ